MMTIGNVPDRPSSFKERVKVEREQEILQAARDVFAERGFEKTSIDDIAERVGIGKGTVYLHFASKEELLIALMRQACLRLVDVCEAAAAVKSTPTAKLDSIIEAIVDHRYANERWVGLVAKELPVFLGYKERLGASSELRGLITRVIEQGQAEGAFDMRVVPAMAAMTLLFLIFVGPTAAGEAPTTKPALLAAARQLYFHGITKEVVA
jgi:AcrR family transcriptional regulator